MKCIFILALSWLVWLEPTFGQNLFFRKITTDNGLSHNTVYCLLQDDKGFMWFGTREGLNRFDSYTVKSYNIYNIRTGGSANKINTLSRSGKYIYAGTDNGLYRYQSDLDTIKPYSDLDASSPVISLAITNKLLYAGTTKGFYKIDVNGHATLLAAGNKAVTAITILPQNKFLLAAANTLLILKQNGVVERSINQSQLRELQKADFTVLNISGDNDYRWLCSNYGLYQFNVQSGTIKKLEFETHDTRESHTVRAVTRNQDKLYIGTENGMYSYDLLTGKSLNYQQSFNYDPRKLNDKAVYSAYTARDGSVWLGTYFGGVNYIPSVSYGFKTIMPGESPTQLNGKAISQLMEDSHHNIWIGTEDGGISIYNQGEQKFTNINTASRPFHLAINNVHAIYDDGDGSVWVGTFLGGLHQFNLKTGVTNIYTRHNSDGCLSNDLVYAIYRDSRNVLWIGTQRGLNTFNYKTGKFSLFKPKVFGDSFVYDITEDHKGNLWFCTRWNGLLRYDVTTQRIIHYKASSKPGTLSSNQVISVYKDSHNQLWFGTLDGGVSVYSYATNKFTSYRMQEGLPNNNVYGILEDGNGNMWFSTNRGLSQYNLAKHRFINFDSRYGLPTNQFNFKSFLKTSNGEFYFGSIKGLCYFNPLTIKPRQKQLPIRFTGFQLFNKPVNPGPNSLFTKQIDEADIVNLKYSQNVFSISYTAINFANVKGNNYSYYLEGFEKKWNNVSDKNLVTYTNLSPGSYIFHLIARDVAGTPISRERTLHINIAPPFYLSHAAFVIYFLVICFAIWLYAYFIKFLHTKKLEIQLERIEKEKTKELTQHRLNFFTFISHEFKTPLTLIIASIEKLLEESKASPDRKSELSIIKNNAARLFKLIQQLIEFRKIETDHEAIKLSYSDLVGAIGDVVQSFKTIAHNKGLAINYTPLKASYKCYYDVDKTEKILFNLISNAIKNTQEGQVDVLLSFDERENETLLSLTIKDTGRGMSQKELSHMFEHFYQGGHDNEGNGIGLALVNSLIKYMNGNIQIKSEPQVGTEITLLLPVYNKLTASQKSVPAHMAPAIAIAEDEKPVDKIIDKNNGGEQTLLIVEDNRELLSFLSKHFSKSYHIITATNGQTGYAKAVKYIPDLIISDIRMPKMDGIVLCEKIKLHPQYKHIPVILLSDNAKENVRIDGFDVGADAYLAKPFNLKEFELLVTNIIKSRVQLREHLLDMSKFGLEKLPRNNKDQEFLANLSIVLERNFANQQFTVEQMAEELNISRTLLHLNLKKTLNKSANHLLNEYRLKKAILMLQNNLPINEIAYNCGYSDPNYFSRIFKKYYNVSPGAYKEQTKETAAEMC